MPQTTPNRGYEYPCYSDLADFPTQMQTLATDIDTDVDTIVDQINTIGLARTSALLRRVAVLPVANNTQTPIVWDSAPQPGYWAAGSTITFPKNAAYIAQASAQWDVHDTGTRQVDLRRLTPSAHSFAIDVRDGVGAAVIPGFDVPGNVATAMFRVAAGDTMQVRVMQNSGVALNLLGVQFSIMEVSQ